MTASITTDRRRAERGFRSDAVLLAILSAAILSTAIHYTDNAIAIERYPGTETWEPAVVPLAWVALTAIGLLGYRLYLRGDHLPAHLCLLVYSVTGLSSLGHYRSGDWSEFTSTMHVSILADGLTGAAVLAFAVWSGLRLGGRFAGSFSPR